MSRYRIDKYKSDLPEAIKQIELCNYKTFVGSPLENNVAYIAVKETIEESQRTVNMTFGMAIDALKKGHKVERNGWNGKGIFLELQVPDSNSKMTKPYIYINTLGLHAYYPDAPKGIVPWVASQTDMLAEDWMVVE